MKVFISSLITGMEAVRAAAREAVTVLGDDPVMAEDFGAKPTSPQIACLEGVRQSAVLVLVLGSRYGEVQASGLSATHEEYREARQSRPVLAFVQEGMQPEARQTVLIQEAQNWGSGLIRASFTDPDDLKTKIIRSLHEAKLSSASAPFDANETLSRALGVFPARFDQDQYEPELWVGVAGGPAQSILRPSQIEDPSLAEQIEKEALFGPARIFSRQAGVTSSVADQGLLLVQGDRRRQSVLVDPQDTILVRQSLGREASQSFGASVIVVEDVHDRLTAALRFNAWVLDTIDPTHRLSHLVVAAQVIGGFAMRTRKEIEMNPNTIQMGYGLEKRPPVHLLPAHMPRPQLTHQRDQIADDLVTLLRRQWRQKP